MKCFIDKNKNKNLNHGLEYYATGKIVKKYHPTVSGKEVCVEYISPFGEYECEWRSYDEIEIFEIDDDYLEWKLKEIKNRAIK